MVKKKYPVLKAQTGIEIAGYAIKAFKKKLFTYETQYFSC